MIVDYHMHLRGESANGEGPIEHTVGAVERFAETAAARGVDEIGFTGRDLDHALDLLRETGYETVTVYEGRRARQEPLG